MVEKFKFSRIPDINFGLGKLKVLQEILHARKFDKCMILTGKKSFTSSDKWEKLQKVFKKEKISFFHESIYIEPNTVIIDQIVSEYKNVALDCVISIGGGSVLDAGKAISAMLLENGSIIDYLEGVGHKEPSGKKIPFIAIPTTAGTGSETTKNAVITEVGSDGFKKSLRHDNYVPDIAIIDPELCIPCPPGITTACGMDAFTQLIESYVSSRASVITDGLALTGLYQSVQNLYISYIDPGDVNARMGLSYASMISGMTLANAGLGTVHGFASSIGGFFDIPHGVVCGTLMGEVINSNIDYMLTYDKGNPALKKYARIGEMFAIDEENKKDEEYCRLLIDKINLMIQRFDIPGLGNFGLKESDLDKIIAFTGQKNNPVILPDSELRKILLKRL